MFCAALWHAHKAATARTMIRNNLIDMLFQQRLRVLLAVCKKCRSIVNADLKSLVAHLSSHLFLPDDFKHIVQPRETNLVAESR